MAYPGDARRARCSWRWAGTRSVKAHPLAQARIRRTRDPAGPGSKAARSAGLPDHGLFSCRGRWWCGSSRGLVNYAQCRGSHKHAIAHVAVEIPLALDAAIVLARVLFEFDADPFACGEVGVTDEAYDGIAAVGQLHDLTDS